MDVVRYHIKKQQFRATLYAHTVSRMHPSFWLATTLSVKPNNKSKITAVDIRETGLEIWPVIDVWGVAVFGASLLLVR